MGRTACTEPQCLYKGALYVFFKQLENMQEERLPKLIMEWISGERRKRGRPRKT